MLLALNGNKRRSASSSNPHPRALLWLWLYRRQYPYALAKGVVIMLTPFCSRGCRRKDGQPRCGHRCSDPRGTRIRPRLGNTTHYSSGLNARYHQASSRTHATLQENSIPVRTGRGQSACSCSRQSAGTTLQKYLGSCSCRAAFPSSPLQGP